MITMHQLLAAQQGDWMGAIVEFVLKTVIYGAGIVLGLFASLLLLKALWLILVGIKEHQSSPESKQKITKRRLSCVAAQWREQIVRYGGVIAIPGNERTLQESPESIFVPDVYQPVDGDYKRLYFELGIWAQSQYGTVKQLFERIARLYRYFGAPRLSKNAQELSRAQNPITGVAADIFKRIFGFDYVGRFYQWACYAMLEHALAPVNYQDDAESEWNAGPSLELPLDWEQRRAAVIERDGNRCTVCGADITAKHPHVHHIIPRSQGGNSSFRNLATLCKSCHSVIADGHGLVHWKKQGDFQRKRASRVWVFADHLKEEHPNYLKDYFPEEINFDVDWVGIYA